MRPYYLARRYQRFQTSKSHGVAKVLFCTMSLWRWPLRPASTQTSASGSVLSWPWRATSAWIFLRSLQTTLAKPCSSLGGHATWPLKAWPTCRVQRWVSFPFASQRLRPFILGCMDLEGWRNYRWNKYSGICAFSRATLSLPHAASFKLMPGWLWGMARFWTDRSQSISQTNHQWLMMCCLEWSWNILEWSNSITI